MLKTACSAYHTNACCKPEYAIRGIINSIRLSNRGATTDFSMDPKDEFVARLISLLFLFDRKHIRMMPSTTQQRKIVNNKFLPVTVSPSCTKSEYAQFWHQCPKEAREFLYHAS